MLSKFIGKKLAKTVRSKARKAPAFTEKLITDVGVTGIKAGKATARIGKAWKAELNRSAPKKKPAVKAKKLKTTKRLRYIPPKKKTSTGRGITKYLTFDGKRYTLGGTFGQDTYSAERFIGSLRSQGLKARSVKMVTSSGNMFLAVYYRA